MTRTPAAPAVAFTATLALLMAFASLSTDLYLPAMPVIAAQFGALNGRIEWTLSAFLLGFSLGQLVWGPLSDAWGRKSPLFLGIALFVAGTIGCGLSQSTAQMIGWRVVQALGACAGPVLARAMVRDCLARDAGARLLSTLALVMAIAPIAGPIVGGQILRVASWPAIFWVLAGIGLLSMAAVAALPDTLPPASRRRVSPAGALRSYADLLRDRPFATYALTVGCLYFGVFAYVAATPFAYISYYGVSPQRYGLLFGLVIIGLVIVNFINARLVLSLGADRLLRIGCALALAFSLVAGVTAITGLGGLPALVGTLLFAISVSGLIAANAIASALAPQGARAGAASALIGALQYGGGIFGSAATGWLADGTSANLGWTMAASGLGVWVFGLLATRVRPPDSLRR